MAGGTVLKISTYPPSGQFLPGMAIHCLEHTINKDIQNYVSSSKVTLYNRIENTMQTHCNHQMSSLNMVDTGISRYLLPDIVSESYTDPDKYTESIHRQAKHNLFSLITRPPHLYREHRGHPYL